jgi:hypothetical protein
MPHNIEQRKFTQAPAPGELAWLPSIQDLTAADNTFCVEKQRTLNAGAFDHPCVVLKSSSCSHLVYCAPCTSFGGKGIKAKFDKANKNSDAFYRHLSIKSEGSQPHSSLPELHLQANGGPKKTTYIVLGKGFWIERWALNTYRIGGQAQVLQPASLEFLKYAHQIAESYHAEQDQTQHRKQGANSPLAQPCWRQKISVGGRTSPTFKPATCSQSATFTPRSQVSFNQRASSNHVQSFNCVPFISGNASHSVWTLVTPYVTVNHYNH